MKNDIPFAISLQSFQQEVDAILLKKAEEKGYSKGSEQGGRELRDFISSTCGNAHMVGEIIYKVIRYQKKMNKEDLVKIAAWAFLAWDEHGG